jgi:hypothetical protein
MFTDWTEVKILTAATQVNRTTAGMRVSIVPTEATLYVKIEPIVSRTSTHRISVLDVNITYLFVNATTNPVQLIYHNTVTEYPWRDWMSIYGS